MKKELNVIALENSCNTALVNEHHVVKIEGNEITTLENSYFIEARFYTIEVEATRATLTIYDSEGSYIDEFILEGSFIEELPEEQPRLTLTNYVDYELETIEPIDMDAVRDVELCMINDRQCYEQFKNIIATLAKKIKNDTFDEHKATKAFYNRVCAWLERNDYGYSKATVTVHDRLIIAHNLLLNYEDTIMEQSNYIDITRVKRAWNVYMKHLKDECPDILKDKPALRQEATMWVDELHRNNLISDETRNNIILVG